MVLTGQVEIQVEILNRWRYAAITDGCTGYQTLTVMSLCHCSLLRLISTLEFCRCQADQYMLWK